MSRFGVALSPFKCDMTFRDRLKLTVDRVGNAAKLGRLSGVPSRTIRNYLSGRTPEAPVRICEKLAAGAGVRPEWLWGGQPPMLEPQEIEAYNAEQPRPGYAYIPVYNVAAGAAPNGRKACNERVVDVLAFKEDWIRQEIRVRPDDLRLIHVEGDSMEPDLRAGDIVLLDTTDTQARREGIYVIRMDGALLVKSLQRLPGGMVKVVSRNPAYEAFSVTVREVEHPNGFGVIGRVVWACRRF
jgi:phage repressor protein C with HTH and peptisase S24 domain